MPSLLTPSPCHSDGLMNEYFSFLLALFEIQVLVVYDRDTISSPDYNTLKFE